MIDKVELAARWAANMLPLTCCSPWFQCLMMVEHVSQLVNDTVTKVPNMFDVFCIRYTERSILALQMLRATRFGELMKTLTAIDDA